MSKKHYVALARDLGITLAETDNDHARLAVWNAINDMARAMKRDNPNFDQGRFSQAIKDQEDKVRNG